MSWYCTKYVNIVSGNNLAPNRQQTIINSLWPNDAIWSYRSWSTLACCLMAPSHCLNQCWLIINVILWYLHLRAMSQEMLLISILEMSLTITNLRSQPHLSGANELKQNHTVYSTLLTMSDDIILQVLSTLFHCVLSRCWSPCSYQPVHQMAAVERWQVRDAWLLVHSQYVISLL